MTWFECNTGGGGGSSGANWIYTKERLFAQADIGTTAWRDDTDSVSLYLNSGSYSAVEGEYVELTSANQARYSFAVSGSYNLFGIKCQIDSNFSPNNADVWYNASCILDCELGGQQKDFAIIIDKNGYFALGWANASITSSTVSALDGNDHELMILPLDGKIIVFIDGVAEIEQPIIMSGGEFYNIGVMWNNSSSNTRVNGKIYSVGCWNYDLQTNDYNLPSM